MMRGTGIYINIGKTLVAMNRTHAYELLNIPFEEYINDRNFCPKVMEMGYDSLQIFNSLFLKEAELIFCTGKCATDIVKTACPPIELRTGWNATKECICNVSYPLLNCNNKITDALDCHNIGIETIKKKQTCFFEDFTWINEFRHDNPSLTIFYSWHGRTGLEDLTKLTSTIDKYKSGGWGTILVDSGHLINLNSNISTVLQKMDSMHYDVVPIRDSIATKVKRTASSYKFHMLSLTSPDFLRSVIVQRGGVKIGFISYSIGDLNTMGIDEVVQLIRDEALCLKRWTDVIVLLGCEEPHVDTYVTRAVTNLVDITLSGNAQVSTSCSGLWHTNNENLVVHSQHDGSHFILVSIEVLSSSHYAMKSDTIKL